MPTVSVILTSFNHEKYIREAIESVLNQVFTDFELIIWDDCSSDNSWHIISQYSDPRIKTFRNEVTKGPVEGVNKAISEVASGKYIGIHHSDDVWEVEKLKKQVAFLDSHPEIGAVFTNALAIGEDSGLLNDTSHFYSNIFDQPNRTRHEWLNYFFYRGNALCHPSLLIRKRCYSDCGPYRFGLAQMADFDMWIRLCLKYEIRVLPEKLIRFRVRDKEANASGNRPETRIRGATEFYQLFAHYLKLDSFEEFVTVFPEAKQFYKKNEVVPGFVLAMLSLEPDTLHVAKAFGVISLFNLIWDDKLSEKIKKLYGFDYNNLIEITGKYDIFSLETAATLRSTLAEHESQSTILDPAVNERDNRIAILNQAHFEANTRLTAIENSTLWKMTAPLRRVLTRTPTLRKLFRRSIKLVWWTSTFQLGTRLREWKARDIKVIDVPHFAPPTDDWSLAVPLGFNTDAWKSALPEVAVICHMFYPEMADEFQGYLTNIPFPFDLLITTDSQEKRAIIEIHFSQWKRGKIEVRIAPNRGRDIAPKLITCRDAYDKYEFILHIHTKKSPHHAHWGGWRHHLLETLLGSEKIVESVFESFKSDSKLGMISPQHYTPVRNWIGWGWNFENAKTFARALNINISLNGQIDFPSGSMFWARSAALKPLLDYNLSLDEFPIEDNQNDGTLGHVIERLYFFICERAGYRWIKVSRSIPPEQMERTKYVENQKQLTDFIIGAQSKLLQPGILPRNRSFLGKSREDASGEHRKLSQLVYEKSDYKYMDFSQFQHELALHIQKKQSLIDFDEKFYLGANPDAAVSVATGIFSCGFIHYCMVGRDEGRVWSDYQLKRIFSLSSNFPNGFSAPIHFRPLKRHSIDLSSLPRNPARFLLILISHLQDDLFFAGYTAFFSDFCPIFGKFSKVIFSIESERYNPRLATQYSDRIEVVQERKLRELKFRPDLIVAFNSQLFIKAKQIFNDPTRTIYYCQDFESGFFPYSAEYVEAAKAIVDTQNIIVSTDLLRKFLVNRQLLSHQRIYTTSPKIEPFDVPPEKTKRLFFYFRPESFHRRNLPETLIEAVQDFCNKHTGYEIYMVGSVDTRFSYKINNTPVYVISKLPKKEYLHLISSSDVVISMIYSAHPGLIAFQAAASGIPTVTNVFENRNKFLLKNISENILPYDPIRDNLLERIEEALSMPKGRKSFNEELYSGSKSQTLNDFIDTVLSSECVGLSSQKQL